MPLEREVHRVKTGRVAEEKAASKEDQLNEFASLKEIRGFEARLSKKESLTEEEQARYLDLVGQRKERKAKLVQVLERGIVAERLSVDLPSDMYGEWVADDPMEVSRMEALGFWIDREYAKKRRLHADGSDASYIGDVVFMCCTRDQHELLEEIRIERKEAMHGKAGEKGKEEKDYSAKVREETPEVPVIDDSKARRVDKEQILGALNYRE